MHEAFVQQIVSNGALGIDLRAIAYLLQNSPCNVSRRTLGMTLQRIWRGLGQAIPHGRLAEVNISAPFLAASLLQFQLAALVHVLRLPPI